MSDPALPMQAAIVTALRGSAALAGLVGTRIYDRVPATAAGARATFPYVTLGEGQTIPDLSDCLEGAEHFFSVHAWSQAPGFPECKAIAAAIHAALHGAALDVEGFRLVDLNQTDAQYLRDPDGVTQHAALTFRALLDPTD